MVLQSFKILHTIRRFILYILLSSFPKIEQFHLYRWRTRLLLSNSIISTYSLSLLWCCADFNRPGTYRTSRSLWWQSHQLHFHHAWLLVSSSNKLQAIFWMYTEQIKIQLWGWSSSFTIKNFQMSITFPIINCIDPGLFTKNRWSPLVLSNCPYCEIVHPICYIYIQCLPFFCHFQFLTTNPSSYKTYTANETNLKAIKC